MENQAEAHRKHKNADTASLVSNKTKMGTIQSRSGPVEQMPGRLQVSGLLKDECVNVDGCRADINSTLVKLMLEPDERGSGLSHNWFRGGLISSASSAAEGHSKHTASERRRCKACWEHTAVQFPFLLFSERIGALSAFNLLTLDQSARTPQQRIISIMCSKCVLSINNLKSDMMANEKNRWANCKDQV